MRKGDSRKNTCWIKSNITRIIGHSKSSSSSGRYKPTTSRDLTHGVDEITGRLAVSGMWGREQPSKALESSVPTENRASCGYTELQYTAFALLNTNTYQWGSSERRTWDDRSGKNRGHERAKGRIDIEAQLTAGQDFRQSARMSRPPRLLSPKTRSETRECFQHVTAIIAPWDQRRERASRVKRQANRR